MTRTARNSHRWILLLIILAFAGCRPASSERTFTGLPLVVTNVTYPNGGSAWIVQNTNGVSVYMEQSKVDVNFALNSSMTIEFDSRTRAVTNVVLEKPGDSNAPGEYVFDFNGDGIPDQRHIKTADGNELFYRGRWYPYKPTGSKMALVNVDGASLKMVFDGTQWSAATKEYKGQ